MTGSIIRRLEKLETRLLPLDGKHAARAMTGDELEIRLLELLPRLAADPAADPNERDEANAKIAEIEAGIRLQASRRSGPVYEARLVDLTRMKRDTISYVPAVTPDGERDSLDTPRLMARRAALWARPDVMALAGPMP